MKTGADLYKEVSTLGPIEVIGFLDALEDAEGSDMDHLVLRRLPAVRAAIFELIEAAKVLVDACNPETKGWDLTVNILERIA